MNLQQRTAALLQLVAQHRATRIGQTLQPAQEQARALRRAARAEARRRVHTAVAEERKRQAVETGAVEARLATERRLAGQQRAVLLLAQAWDALRYTLLHQWQQPATRARWIETHLQRAECSLADPAGPAESSAASAAGAGRRSWQLSGPPDWAPVEYQAVAAELHQRAAVEVTFVPDAGIAAGWRLQAGHNRLDATVDGLLADRAAIEGRLLQLLQDDSR